MYQRKTFLINLKSQSSYGVNYSEHTRQVKYIAWGIIWNVIFNHVEPIDQFDIFE